MSSYSIISFRLRVYMWPHIFFIYMYNTFIHKSFSNIIQYVFTLWDILNYVVGIMGKNTSYFSYSPVFSTLMVLFSRPTSHVWHSSSKLLITIVSDFKYKCHNFLADYKQIESTTVQRIYIFTESIILSQSPGEVLSFWHFTRLNYSDQI